MKWEEKPEMSVDSKDTSGFVTSDEANDESARAYVWLLFTDHMEYCI